MDDFPSEDEDDQEPQFEQPVEIPVEEEFTAEELEGIDPSWPDRIRRIGARKKREELEQKRREQEEREREEREKAE